MQSSTRFALAVELLCQLAAQKNALVKSEDMARSANVNPAAARRILAMLGAAGLTESQIGKSGGTRLRRSPKKINLADVYLAVETSGLLTLRANDGFRVEQKSILREVAKQAEAAFLQDLRSCTLKKLLKQMQLQKQFTP